MIKAIYPGSFDPITNGHLDIIYRASKIFNRIVVVVAENSRKKSLFSMEEKVNMIQNVIAELQNVEVQSFRGLLIDCARSNHANIILRGMRVFGFWVRIAVCSMNKKMAPEIETVFMVTSTRFSYLNSSIVKEVASLNGCIGELVPPFVEKMLKTKYGYS